MVIKLMEKERIKSYDRRNDHKDTFQCAHTCSATHHSLRYRKQLDRFQSLMGFPMRCDENPRQNNTFEFKVSIPYGFSNALRQGVSVPASSNASGFNPLWVFQCAATITGRDSGYTVEKFQSLMGFPMRCDVLLLS